MYLFITEQAAFLMSQKRPHSPHCEHILSETSQGFQAFPTLSVDALLTLLKGDHS